MTDKERERNRRYQHETYEWYKSHRICFGCRSETTDGRVYCEKCRKKKYAYMESKKDYMKEYMHNRYVRLKEQGICTVCGKEKSIEGTIKCPDCTAKCREYQNNRYRRSKHERYDPAGNDEKPDYANR